NSGAPQSSIGDVILAVGQWVLLCVPSGFLVNTDNDPVRIGGSGHVGLINSVAQLGGFAGPYVIGFLNDRTHSLTAGFGFIALAFAAAGSVILGLRIRDPLHASQSSA